MFSLKLSSSKDDNIFLMGGNVQSTNIFEEPNPALHDLDNIQKRVVIK